MHQSRDILSRQFFMLRWIFLFFPYSMLFFLFAYRSGLSQIYMVKTCRRSSSIVLLQTVSPCLYINENHIEYFLCGSNHGLYSKFFLIWYAKTVWVHDYSIFLRRMGCTYLPYQLLKIFNMLKDSWMCFVGISNSFIYNDVTQMFRRHCYFTLNLIMRSLPKICIHEYSSFKICRVNVVTAMNFSLQKFLAFLLAKMCMPTEVWSFLQIVF